MKRLGTFAFAVFVLTHLTAGEGAAQGSDAKLVFSASTALLSKDIQCEFVYPSDARTNTVAGLAKRAGIAVEELLTHFENGRRRQEAGYAADPAGFCGRVSGLLRDQAGLDVGSEVVPDTFDAPLVKPATRDEKERYLHFIASSGYYALNDRCRFGGDSRTLLSDIGKLAEKLRYDHRSALQYFVYGTTFYIEDHAANPEQRCKLTPLLLDMTRTQIGF